MCDKRARWGSFGVSGTEPSTQKVSGVAFAAIVAARAADRLADEQTNLGIGRSCVVIFSIAILYLRADRINRIGELIILCVRNTVCGQCIDITHCTESNSAMLQKLK